MNLTALLENVAGLFGGVTVSLGPLTLGSFEVPESIPSALEQRGPTHEIVGGGRVIQTTGAQYEPIQFSGTWSGGGAIQRALSVDAIVRAGQPVALMWGPRTYQVIVRRHEADDRSNLFWIPYQIRVDVLSDGIPPAAAALDPKAGILGDLGSAVSSAAQTVSSALAPIAGLISTAQTVLNVAGPLLPGSTVLRGVQLLSTASGAVGTGLSTANAAFAATSPSNLSMLVSTGGDLALVTQARGYVQRAATNLGLINGPPTGSGASNSAPANAVTDTSGNYVVDTSGNYIVGVAA